MSNPNQLFLLVDHLKLSLLERQRAISLNLEPNSQDGHISRSLDSLRDGIEALEKEVENGDLSGKPLKDREEFLMQLRKHYDDLSTQFRNSSGPDSTPSSIQTQATSLTEDTARASLLSSSRTARPKNPSSSSFLKKSGAAAGALNSKSVRFSDNPNAESDAEPERDELFPTTYRDDPDAPNVEEMDNQGIHAYHEQVMQDQDEHLDRLGESIGRQRELSIQIGDELETHVELLDDVDERVDRTQGRLDGAKKKLGTVARRAKDNVQLTIILVLIIILVLLIIVLK
jgi:syntaxin 8